MAKKRSRRNTIKRMSRTKSMLPSHKRFPKPIRDEFRMTCAFLGYSTIRAGKGKTFQKQNEFINGFYQGDHNNSPSHIKMLAEGIALYSDLCSTRTMKVLTNKKSSASSNNAKKFISIMFALIFTILMCCVILKFKTSFFTIICVAICF